jgi:predicted nucleic acid-binding protein
MIILDTNVLSGLMQQQPDPQVVAWLDRSICPIHLVEQHHVI